MSTLTDVEVDVDLDIEVACEYSLHPKYSPHDPPAEWVVKAGCPSCMGYRKYMAVLRCSNCIEVVSLYGTMKCHMCGEKGLWTEFWKLLYKLG